MSDSRIVDMSWLATASDVAEELRRASHQDASWSDLVRLANLRLDFLQTARLDRALQKWLLREKPIEAAARLKLALLASSTVDHLLPSLRVAALRRNFALELITGDYGMYRHELEDQDSALRAGNPDVILFAFHAQHLLGAPDPSLAAADAAQLVENVVARVSGVWKSARQWFGGQILQQTILPTALPLIGSNEQLLRGSQVRIIDEINSRLGEIAATDRVELVSLQQAIQTDGLFAWHDPVLWYRAKQEISPVAAPAYGDLVFRVIAAQRGRSAKCLVLDLDNTLWGGVIGDDGLEGIRLGQGSALGEAFVAFQQYAKDLARRGVILAVCSKNDVENARAPFEKHPDMVLKSHDIACFVANWSDKATNLRTIAEQLNIGIDSLVFADDNPFERNIVRRELPMVAVPELPEDPAFYARTIANAGYFEAVQVTQEDFERGGQYQANAARETLRAAHTDLAGYLRSLNMELRWQPFDRVNLQRVVQLINKTNQFNLTTKRYTEAEVANFIDAHNRLTLQLRLVDQFGDNGIIAIIIGSLDNAKMCLDTWLMSCRVLGRQVEEATLNLIASESARMGATEIVGEYLPTKKNGMVRDHFSKLGFSRIEERTDHSTLWNLSLAGFSPFSTSIQIVRSN